MTPDEAMRKKILDDLKKTGSRTYHEISERLRIFVTEHIPEAEIVRIGNEDVLRLKASNQGE